MRICAKHSKQLAEARERAKQKQTKDTETLQQLKYELAASQDDIQKLKVQVEKVHTPYYLPILLIHFIIIFFSCQCSKRQFKGY